MATAKNKALFLDRDGIIIEDAGYTKDPSLVKLIPGICELLIAARHAGYLLIVVTNQSGIGRGSISWENYQAVSSRMIELLEEHNCPLFNHIYFAPFFAKAETSIIKAHGLLTHQHPQGVTNEGLWSEDWRKPALGMLKAATSQYNIELSQSIMVGDRWTDQLLAVRTPMKLGFWYCQDTLKLEEYTEFLSHQDIQGSKIALTHDLTSIIPSL